MEGDLPDDCRGSTAMASKWKPKSKKARPERTREWAACMTSTGEEGAKYLFSVAFNGRVAKEQLAEMAQGWRLKGAWKMK